MKTQLNFNWWKFFESKFFNLTLQCITFQKFCSKSWKIFRVCLTISTMCLTIMLYLLPIFSFVQTSMYEIPKWSGTLQQFYSKCSKTLLGYVGPLKDKQILNFVWKVLDPILVVLAPQLETYFWFSWKFL